jgi:HK97 gp10 family phage protein
MAKNTIQFTLVGEKELRRMLESLPRKMSGPVVRKALREGAKPILAAARAAAPISDDKDPGGLKKSMSPGRGIRIRTYRRSGTTVAVIGPAWPQGAHGHLIEFGTEPRFTKDGKYRGIGPAKPFFRPAFDANIGRAKRIIAIVMARGLAAAAKKQ